MNITPMAVLPVANILGEGVRWNVADLSFWWTDIQSRWLFRHDPATGAIGHFALPERLGAFSFIAGDDGLICAFETGFARFWPESGRIIWLHKVEEAGSGRRLNDGRTDPFGRFWAGSMVEDATSAGENSAALWCLDGDGSLRKMRGGIAISNGLCSSPDGARLYFADSPTRQIRWFDPCTDSGFDGAGTLFAETSPGAYPDGAAVDAEGCLWVALWGGGRIARFSPDGELLLELPVPASQPTCVSFGGPALDMLCITSARDGLSQPALLAEPEAGHVFLFRVGVRGLPETLWGARSRVAPGAR